MWELEELVKSKLHELVGKSSYRLRLSAISDCPRRHWWRAREGREEEEVVDEELVGIYAAGIVWEKAILDLLGVPEELRQVEVDICGVKGHIDGILTIDDKPVIVDIKTTSLALIASAPYHSHMWQVRAYAVGYKGAHGIAPSVALIYIAREKPISANPQSPKVWASEYSEEWEISVKETAKALLSDEVPSIPPTYAPDRLPCEGMLYGRYERCPYYERCWQQPTMALAKTRYIEIAEKTAIDEIGEQRALLKTLQRESLEQQLRDAIRKCLDKNPDVMEVVIEGVKWRVVGRRHKQRTFDMQRAIEALRKHGENIDAFYVIKEVPYVTWSRISEDET